MVSSECCVLEFRTSFSTHEDLSASLWIGCTIYLLLCLEAPPDEDEAAL